MESSADGYSIYVLWSEKLEKRYVGSGKDPIVRVREHNAGQSNFTRGGRPWILIYAEEHGSNTESLRREQFLKSGVGRKWLDDLFPQYRAKRKGS
jgi:putative endonuclease